MSTATVSPRASLWRSMPMRCSYSPVPGLLRDPRDPSSLIAETTLDEAEKLAQGRMKKKILAAREAIEGGVGEVVIRSASGDPRVRTVIQG